MKIVGRHLGDVLELDPPRHDDSRGSFTVIFSATGAAEVGISTSFVQLNESRSVQAGTVRGIHLQVAPLAQGKLVWVSEGRIIDIAVDLRAGSPTFGSHVAVELSEETGSMLWVPAGFGHGFCTLEPNTRLTYAVDAAYSPGHERVISWSDPELGIEWPVSADDVTLSDRDAGASGLAEYRAEVAADPSLQVGAE